MHGATIKIKKKKVTVAFHYDRRLVVEQLCVCCLLWCCLCSTSLRLWEVVISWGSFPLVYVGYVIVIVPTFRRRILCLHLQREWVLLRWVRCASEQKVGAVCIWTEGGCGAHLNRTVALNVTLQIFCFFLFLSFFCIFLFCKMNNKCTIISQIVSLLHVSTLSCHPQTACNQHLAKLHQFFKCSCR
jgi:hypothetical protein